MSTAITAYAVDLDALRGAVGGGDPAVVTRARAAHFRQEDHERIRALVVYGPEAVSWSDGAYALEALCRAFGRELPGEAMGGLGGAAAARLAALDCRLEALGIGFSWAQSYASSGAPCDMPRRHPVRLDRWPHVFHLSTDDTRALDTALRGAMAPSEETALLRHTLARARADRAPRGVINWLQRWMAAWPVFGEVRGAAAPLLFETHGLPASGPVPPTLWIDIDRGIPSRFSGLDWRAAALLEETAGWLRAAAERGQGLVGFEY